MPPVRPTTTVRPSSRTGLALRSRRRRLARREPQQPPERQVLARQEDARGRDVDHHLDDPGEERVPDRDVVTHVKPTEREHAARLPCAHEPGGLGQEDRSEEHTSELQSPYDLVCRLLLEKKKKTKLTT